MCVQVGKFNVLVLTEFCRVPETSCIYFAHMETMDSQSLQESSNMIYVGLLVAVHAYIYSTIKRVIAEVNILSINAMIHAEQLN